MKTVLITGASSGIGLECVIEFLRQGYVVFAGARSAHLSESNPNELDEIILKAIGAPTRPANLHWVVLDVTVPEQIAAAVNELKKTTQQLDVLVNNAGVGVFGPLESATLEQWRRQFEVNVFGLVAVTQAFLPLLIAAKGKLFQISSILGVQGMPFASPYVASKFAVEGLSESLAYELSALGVQVCVIEPGRHASRFQATVMWGQKLEQDEIKTRYGKAVEKYRYYRGHQEKQSIAPPASNVAKEVVGLATQIKGSLPMRVPVGTDAVWVSRFRKVFPGWIWQRLVLKLSKQLFR